MFIYPIYNHNWRNIGTIYIYIRRLAPKKYSYHPTKYIGKYVRLRTYQHPSMFINAGVGESMESGFEHMK
jgi:hypothetical protein